MLQETPKAEMAIRFRLGFRDYRQGKAANSAELNRHLLVGFKISLGWSGGRRRGFLGCIFFHVLYLP
jgi:hypothetical protein